MDALARNNVRVAGDGNTTLVFPHGFQCHDDLIAPRPVGDFLARTLPQATLRVIDNVGHCPHLSSPSACASAMDEFLTAIGA